MWLEKGLTKVSLAVAVVIIGVCVGWALLVQVMVTPACDMTPPPSNAGYLDCSASD